MVKIEHIAEAALQGDGLIVRSLTQDFLRQTPLLINITEPEQVSAEVLTTSAALLELFASRRQESPPLWTAEVDSLENPKFLLKSAERMKHLRHLCQTESPLPLRKRNLYAPPNYLDLL